MRRLFSDLEYISLHRGDSDFNHFRFQEGVVVYVDCVREELVLFCSVKLLTGKTGTDKASDCV